MEFLIKTRHLSCQTFTFSENVFFSIERNVSNRYWKMSTDFKAKNRTNKQRRKHSFTLLKCGRWKNRNSISRRQKQIRSQLCWWQMFDSCLFAAHLKFNVVCFLRQQTQISLTYPDLSPWRDPPALTQCSSWVVCILLSPASWVLLHPGWMMDTKNVSL